MARKPPEPPIDRSWDHLEAIASTLADLRGAGSLVHELIQNADDAQGATLLSFRFTKHALVVEDNGGFTKCDDLHAHPCPWEPAGERCCDFHAFAKLGAATKKRDPTTTGAFGIGFISVYQLTDRPEVLSAGVHWTVDEEKSQILPCPGCDQPHRRSGTRIVLPWASQDSWLRQKLEADVVTPERQIELRRELIDAIPDSMLFLRKLKRIDVHDDSERIARFRRIAADGTVRIDGPHRTREWLVLTGAFDDAAQPLRDQHARVGDRRAEVSVALNTTGAADGRLYATLPTKVATELPAHINASFYPRRDRKGILLESGAEEDWNRAAIDAAAALLAENAEPIAEALGPRRFWALVKAASQLDAHHSPDVRALAPVWDRLAEALPAARVMWTAAGAWETVSKTVLVPRTKGAGELLAELHVPTVAKEIRGDVPDRRLGIHTVDLDRLVDAIEQLQIEDGCDQAELPAFLQRLPQRGALGVLLAHLVERSTVDDDLRGRLRDLPIWEATDRRFRSFESSYLVDKQTATALGSFTGIALIIWSTRGPTQALGALGDWFDKQRAIKALSEAEPERFVGTKPRQVLRWLNAHRHDLSEEDLETLRSVPCVPTSSGPRSPRDAVRAGGFKDLLGLTGVVDEQAIRGLGGILKLLGVGRLSFRTYLSEHLTRAVEEREPLNSAGLVELIRESVRHWDEIERDKELTGKLTELAWIPCRDGTLRAPSKAYFADARVARVLGDDAPTIVPPISSRTAAGGLLRSLGATHVPRPEDVVAHVERIAEGPPTAQRRAAMKAVLGHLSRRRSELDDPASALSVLKRIAWLAAEGDSADWHPPTALSTGTQRRLFSSSGRFIWVGTKDQRTLARALSALGVRSSPTVTEVAHHVRNLAEQAKSPDGRILGWLDERAREDEIQKLANIAFLPGRDGRLHRPAEIFRRPHPLSERLPVLEQRVGRYARLLDALHVSSRPRGDDAVQVLTDEAAGCQSGHGVAPEALRLMRACWRTIDLDPTCDLSQLSGLPVVPSPEGVVWKASEVVLDDQPGAIEWLHPSARRRVIPDEGIRGGLTRAGVELLSARLQARITNRARARRGAVLEQKLIDRQAQLARIVIGEHGQLQRLLAFAQRLKVRSLPQLRIRYLLDRMDEVQPGPTVERFAHYDRETGELFVLANPTRKRPDQLATCVKDAILPDAGPSVTFPLASVLRLASPGEADAFLNEHGFPTLPDETWQEIRDVVSLWGSTREEPDALESWDEPADEAEAEPEETPVGETDSPPPEPGRDPDPAAEDGDAPPAPVTEVSPSDPPPGDTPRQPPDNGDLRQPEPPGPSDRSSGRPPGDKQPGKSSADRRLVSYVSTGDASDARNEQAGERSAAGDAGVDLVMQHLASELADTDLRARKMPDKNKGYDILVEDPSGQPFRYIEVKSTEERWGLRGVGLSAAQFGLAQQEGERFWLYVVEHLYALDARIWWLQDPARQVTTFQYDEGWSQTAHGNTWVGGARRPEPVREPSQ